MQINSSSLVALTLPEGWVKTVLGKILEFLCVIADKVPVYYNWNEKVFSLTPPLSPINFIWFLVSEN